MIEFINFIIDNKSQGGLILVIIGLGFALRYVDNLKNEYKQDLKVERKENKEDIKGVLAMMDRLDRWVDSQIYGK
tara:strand:+ start:534 stop:758 length:225 start_codon:yes stop_codon:yes gene_type:complete